MATQFDQNLRLLISADGKGLSAGLQKALGEVKSFTATATNAFRTLGQVAGISIGVETLRRTVALVDSYRTLEARIRGITAETQDYAAVSERLREISRATGTQLETTVSVFQALARSGKELGATNDQMTTLTRLVQQLGVLGGASTQALGDGLRQFSQAMGAGVVRAEEFNSILENLPELAAAIAKGLNVSVAELRKMVIGGKLLSKERIRRTVRPGRRNRTAIC